MNINGIKRLAESLTDEAREKRYQYLLRLWIIDNSDELTLNGKVVSEKARFLMKISNYKIEPQPKSFIASKKKNGKELKESDFLSLEIKRIKGFIQQLKENESNETIETLKPYLKELKSKTAPIELIKEIEINLFKEKVLDKKSIYYYSQFIIDWYNTRSEELKKNKNLNSKFELLDNYNFLFRIYFANVIKLVEYSINYEFQPHEVLMFNIKKKELKENVKSLHEFSSTIKRNILKGEYNEAIKIQEYCLLVTLEIKKYLEKICTINIEKTFLKKHFQIIINEIENSIDFDKIKFLKENEKPKIEQSNSLRPNRTDIAFFVFFTTQNKELILNNNFPSDKAWIEIGNMFDKNSKNIQQAYNLIVLNEAERLKKSKIKNIEQVFDKMLDEYPKAKKDAKITLNKAYLNS